MITKYGKVQLSNLKSAFILGLIISFFWALQHPLQSPLYQQLEGNFSGLMEGVVLADLIALPFFILPFLNKDIRAGVIRVTKIPFWYFKALLPAFTSLFALVCYSFGQSSLDPVQVSILLNVSPVAVLMSSLLLSSESDGSKRQSFFIRLLSSKYFWLHIILVLIFVVCTIAENGIGFFKLWYLPMIATLLVPATYIGQSHFVRTQLSGSRGDSEDVDVNAYRAAICLASILGTIVACSIFFIFIWDSAEPIVLFSVNTETIIAFSLGSLSISFFAAWLFHYFLTQPQKIREASSLMFHFVPGFTIIIQIICGYFFEFMNRDISVWSIISVLLIFFTIWVSEYSASLGERLKELCMRFIKN